MKSYRNLILIASIAAISLFVIGSYAFRHIFGFLLSQLKDVELFIVSAELPKMEIFFALNLSIVPVFLAFLWILFKINTFQKRMISIFIVTFSMISSVILYSSLLKWSIAAYPLPFIKTQFNASNFEINKYLFLGFLIGWLISAICLRAQKSFKNDIKKGNL